MPLVKIEETIELPQAREAVWPILSRTDWVNRSIGLPPVHYQASRPEGGGEITAQARIFGLRLAWREQPFEWLEPEFYQVRRIFLSGPFTESVTGVRLRVTGSGCAVDVFAHITPRHVAGEWMARTILGPKSMRDMRALIRHISRHLAGEQKVSMPKLPAQKPDEAKLAAGLARLRGENQPAALVEKLRELLTESPDVELAHIRPFAVARSWNADRWEVLRLFLHATRAGLLNLSWEVLCPNCRSTRAPRRASLAQVVRAAHCDVCNIQYDAEFDQSVELKFSVHPSVRPCDEQTFCLAGPGGRPHVSTQIVLAPNERREWNLPPGRAGTVLLRSPQTGEKLPLSSLQVEIAGDSDKFKPPVVEKVRAFNPNTFPVQLALADHRWSDDILTAARVTNWQEFRDLFVREVISPDEQISVGSQVVLFTDLRGSTAMYSSLGDAPAYVIVRDHFKVLCDTVAGRHGAVVKTIGDAVMAVFSDLAEALAATRQMHEEIANINARKNLSLRLKSGLHAGSCLAVNANDRLDFFGSTVNLAARLVGHGQGDDLVVTDEVYQRDEAQKFMRDLGLSGHPEEERFTGFPEPIKIWRISVQKR